MQDRNTKEIELMEQLRGDFSKKIAYTKIITRDGSFSGSKIITTCN